MSLLTVIQGACRKVGKVPPSVVVTSTDTLVLEMLELSKESGRDLALQFDFPELQKEASWSATSSVYQGQLLGISASAIVSAMDYSRMVPDTFFDRTADYEIKMAVDKTWQQQIAFGTTPANLTFKVYNRGLYIGPVTGPTSGNTLAFFYYSNRWCESSGGTAQANWLADSDLGIIPEQFLILDLVWRYKQSRGLPYAEDMETAQRAIEKYTGAAGGRRLLLLGGGSTGYVTNIPEGDWG